LRANGQVAAAPRAGGIGSYTTQAIQEFQFNVMMTYVLMVMVMVIALDLLSAWLRGRIAQ